MYAPALHDENTTLVNYIDQQLDALRCAAIGLTDAQARLTPCRSALSIGGLVKHATYCMQGALDRLSGAELPVFDQATFARYQASFALTDDESAEDTLAEFDAARAALIPALAAIDPASEMVEPPAPWDGRFEPSTAHARFVMMHQLEEYARHAGHADIIREQIDGVSIAQITATLAGVEPSDYFAPFVAAPGTIGAATMSAGAGI